MATPRHYTRWNSIKQRTGNPNNDCYPRYGGRGIECRFGSFHEFARWLDENLGLCPPDHTLDRIDNNGHYEPGNLRWADMGTQASNRRDTLAPRCPVTDKYGRQCEFRDYRVHVHVFRGLKPRCSDECGKPRGHKNECVPPDEWAAYVAHNRAAYWERKAA